MPITRSFETIEHQADLCVVGGGMAGLIAAITAARHGAKVVLMHDRPVLGGNASSEIRMWICGARGPQAKETGLLEEILLANYHRNPALNYSIWDTVLYEKARFQKGLTLLLNCACHEVETEGDTIRSVKGWQNTTQSFQRVNARYFADCSGDSVLRVCGAEFRRGREAANEFNESHAPEQADLHTMGNSLLIQSRHTGRELPFIPPDWARRLDESDLPNRPLTPTGENFWWLETGGMQDTLRDAEAIRDDLYGLSLGVWGLIQNHSDGRARGWELDWLGALPGKRESFRYVGDHILTQGDILAEGRFDDRVAYGGWTMDDHPPAGLFHREHSTVFHHTPSPYGIPYRCLYSKNITNLFFAGRNISTTHMAMSSTRVMGTCAVLGQAVGTAAALAVQHACSPRTVGQQYLAELQAALIDDDAYIPWMARAIPELTRQARLSGIGDIETLRSGVDRDLDGQDNGWWGAPGEAVTYHFDSPCHLNQARLVFDSDLSDTKRMPCWTPPGGNLAVMPAMLPRAFALETQDAAGNWSRIHLTEDNRARLVRLALDVEACAVRFVPLSTWGGERVHVMGFEVNS